MARRDVGCGSVSGIVAASKAKSVISSQAKRKRNKSIENGGMAMAAMAKSVKYQRHQWRE